MSDRAIRVCLILHSTRSDNLGVGALTAGEVAIIREVGQRLQRKIEITIMDWKDPRKPYVTGPDIEVRDLDGRTIANPRGYFAVARRSDFVIDIGGGDSFADIYGQRRLSRMLALKYLTHLSGTPLILAPQTLGPFDDRLMTHLSRWSIERSAIVAARDALSISAARDIGVTRDIIVASDVALRLPYDPPVPRSPDGPLRIGLNISGLLMHGGYTGRNQFGISVDYPALVRTLIQFLLNYSTECEVHLVPHVMAQSEGETHIEDDAQANRVLAREFPSVIEAPRFKNPSEAKTYIAGLDFFLGARMHACIAAFSSGVPVIPMAYSRKFQGLFGALGYHRTVDCRTQTADEIVTEVVRALSERPLIQKEIEVALAKGHARLNRYSDALERLFRTVP